MKITLTKATAALWRLAALYPDHVNPRSGAVCVYTKINHITGSEEHCIGGQVVKDLTGLSMPAECGGYFDTTGVESDRTPTLWLEQHGVEITEAAKNLIAAVQRKADSHGTHWLQAVTNTLEAR